MSGLRRLFHRQAVDDELDDELRHYLEMSTQDKTRAGLSRSAAERQARLELGGTSVVKDRVRSAGWDARVDSVLQDVHYALRRFRTAPGHAVVAIATLGTGMALTVGVLTVSNAVLRQQWPVLDPSRVVMIVQARAAPTFALVEARYFADHATTLSGVAAVRCVGGWYDECDLEVDGGTLSADLVTANYFSMLGIGIEAGRGFLPTDDRPESPSAVAVLSDESWRSRFGSDSTIIGKQVRIDGTPFKVIGVAARGFTGTRMERRDIWLPLSAMLLLRPGRPEVRDRFTHPLSQHAEASLAARLAPGVTIHQAQAELDALNRRFRAENGLEDYGLRLMPTTLFPNPAKLGMARAMFGAMFAAVTLVLLLACANVGNLLLARAAARGREIAVRLALGASRRRVVRQLLIESLLLAIGAGLLGLAISFRVPAALMRRVAGTVSWHFVPDATVIVVAIGFTALTCVAFGLAPALHATRTDVAAVLKSGEEWGGGVGRRRAMHSSLRLSLRGSLLAIQIAISVLLLVNAGTLVRGIQQTQDRDLGFSSRGISVFSFELPGSYDPAGISSFVRQMTDGVRAIVGSAGVFASTAPFGSEASAGVHLPGQSQKDERVVSVVEISNGFLDMLGMQIVAGRDLRPSDGDGAVLVNQSLARAFWPGGSVLGRTLIDSIGREVVGVVKDANLFRLERIAPTVFRRIGPRTIPVLLVRNPSPAIARAVAGMATRIDSHARVRIESIAGNVDRSLAGFRAVAALAGVLGLVALLIASVGVFGVFGFLVQQRTREIGIRTALGAPHRAVIRLVLRDSSRAIGAGLVLGMGVAIAAARLLESELFGVTAFDPAVFAATGLLLVVAGAAATYVPARRAARIDPMAALRET